MSHVQQCGVGRRSYSHYHSQGACKCFYSIQVNTVSLLNPTPSCYQWAECSAMVYFHGRNEHERYTVDNICFYLSCLTSFILVPSLYLVVRAATVPGNVILTEMYLRNYCFCSRLRMYRRSTCATCGGRFLFEPFNKLYYSAFSTSSSEACNKTEQALL